MNKFTTIAIAPFINTPIYMLTRIFAAIACLLPYMYLSAQLIEPKFKSYSPEEIQMNKCSFDPSADAIVLFDIVNSNYNDEYNLLQKRHVRIKVFNEKGIRNANIVIPFYSGSDFEFIRDIEGAVLTIDKDGMQELKELNRSDIYYEKVNKNYSLVKFALPNVKAGSIIEYTYLSVCKNYGGLRDWFFQTEIPTVYSSFTLMVIPGRAFSYLIQKKLDYPIDLQQNKNVGSTSFTMRNIPGLHEEPYMEAAKDYLQKVEFQLANYTSRFGDKVNYITSWNDITKELMSEPYFGKVIDKKIPGTEALIAETIAIPSMEGKMQFVHNYIRKNIAWNGQDSKYSMNSLKDVWEKKKGNSGELNLLLINILKEVGVEVYPLLVSDRDHGRVNPQVAMLDQFNKVNAYVKAENKIYVLDASDRFTPGHLIPHSILNSHAFLMNGKKSEVIQLLDDKSNHLNVTTLIATINTDGIVEGKRSVISSNYARIEREKSALQDKERFMYNYFSKDKEMKIDSMLITYGVTDTDPMNQEFKFITTTSSTGDFQLLNTNLYTGIDKNPFTADQRFSRINFGSKQQTISYQKYILAAGLKAEELPKNIHIKTPDNSLELLRIMKLEGNELNVQISFKINQPVFNSDDYDSLKDFYKKMNNALNEQVVFKSL